MEDDTEIEWKLIFFNLDFLKFFSLFFIVQSSIVINSVSLQDNVSDADADVFQTLLHKYIRP